MTSETLGVTLFREAPSN